MNEECGSEAGGAMGVDRDVNICRTVALLTFV